MKKIILSTAIVIATGFSGALMAGDHGKSFDHKDKFMVYIAEELELTSEQQDQLKAVHQEHGEKYGLMRQQHQADVNAILTEKQQAKMAELHDKKRKKYAEKGKKKHDHEEKGS